MFLKQFRLNVLSIFCIQAILKTDVQSASKLAEYFPSELK